MIIVNEQVPDIGADDVEVVEIPISVGDEIQVDDVMFVGESTKSTVEVPSMHGGVVKAIHYKVGDIVNKGDLFMDIEVSEAEVRLDDVKPVDENLMNEVKDALDETKKPDELGTLIEGFKKVKLSSPLKMDSGIPPNVRTLSDLSLKNKNLVYAGPSVRKLARKLGVDLQSITNPTGERGRVSKEDLYSYVRSLNKNGTESSAQSSNQFKKKKVDFSVFGEIKEVKMSGLQKFAAENLSMCASTIPHVTQFDKVDVTEIEAYRKSIKGEVGLKVTLLAFIVKAVANCLKMEEHKKMNSSLNYEEDAIVFKDYCNIGVAVDTPKGLLVPVIKDANNKSILALASEIIELSSKAIDGKLTPTEMQGATFTVSSLGGIGGTAFTPIINSPEVAILGVSKATIEPVYIDGEFVPKLMMPISLSYDHRVINGADAAKFTRAIDSKMKMSLLLE